MDGYELARTIRSEENGADRLPIIAITANALQGEAERCFAVGMDDYLSKPVAIPALKSALRKWMPADEDRPDVEAPGIEAAELQPRSRRDDGAASREARHNGSSPEAPVDDSVLREALDDPQTIRRVLESFADGAEDYVKDIAAAHENHRAAELARAAHRLKGSAGAVGARKLADLCFALERAGQADDWDDLDALARQLGPASAEVTDHIKGLLANV